MNAQVMQSSERSGIANLLSRLSAELDDLRRDIGDYEAIVVEHIHRSGHTCGPELQSIDLSLQTIEEIAKFLDHFSILLRSGAKIDTSESQFGFKLAAVKGRLFDVKDGEVIGRSTIDLFETQYPAK